MSAHPGRRDASARHADRSALGRRALRGVLARRFAGQWLAGVLALVGIFVSFFSAGAYPIWSIIALAANGLVLWAVTAHGDEFD